MVGIAIVILGSLNLIKGSTAKAIKKTNVNTPTIFNAVPCQAIAYSEIFSANSSHITEIPIKKVVTLIPNLGFGGFSGFLWLKNAKKAGVRQRANITKSIAVPFALNSVKKNPVCGSIVKLSCIVLSKILIDKKMLNKKIIFLYFVYSTPKH